MKLNLLKKLGILGAVVSMMATTVMAQGWTMNLSKKSYVATTTTAKKVRQNTAKANEYAVFLRGDTGYDRTTFYAYVESISGIYKSKSAEVGGVTGWSYYINYNDEFINKDYKTYAMLGSTSYYPTYTVTANTRP